jgi:hypothetical protein
MNDLFGNSSNGSVQIHALGPGYKSYPFGIAGSFDEKIMFSVTN